VFGIMKTATGFGDMFTPVGSSENYFPENTLLITNYRFLMVHMPISGGDEIVGGADYANINFLFNRGKIRQKGEHILKTDSLPQILNLATNDVLYKDIKTVTLKKTEIIIEKLSGEKLGYLFLDREYVEPIKKLLRAYLSDRFIEK